MAAFAASESSEASDDSSEGGFTLDPRKAQSLLYAAFGSDETVAVAAEICDVSNDEPVDQSTLPPNVTKDQVTSFMSKFGQPVMSKLSRKRAPRSSRVGKSKRVAIGSSSQSKTIPPLARIREFPGQSLVVRAGKLFCQCCAVPVGTKTSTIKNHFKGAGHKSKLETFFVLNQRDAEVLKGLQKYQEMQDTGTNVSDEVRVFRFKVAETFLRAGIAFDKVQYLGPLFEQVGYKVGGRGTLAEYCEPVLLAQQRKKVKDALKDVGHAATVIFDGTTHQVHCLYYILCAFLRCFRAG